MPKSLAFPFIPIFFAKNTSNTTKKMGTFRSIDELVRALDREKVLLKEMFAKRHFLQFRYDYALEMTEYREERIRFLIENGVIRDTGDCLEMEDVYQKFFEDVLEVNEEINVSSVRDYISVLNENIDYYLKENNENRKYKYLKEVRRCLKTIALATVRNVLDLKRNMDNTYKNEPNYTIKKAKLQRLSEKRKNISQLITASERVIDTEQPVFFSVAMDVQMRNLVNDVRLQLNESYHNLLEIERQIIQYLNLIDYQNRIFEKVKKLKYLKDQFRWEEATDVRAVVTGRNAVWLEPQPKYYIKLSIDNLRTSDEALLCIRALSEKIRKRKGRGLGNVAEPIPDDYLKGSKQKLEAVNLQEIFNAFSASSTHLFAFVMNYQYDKKQSREDKLVYFCQIASQYVDSLKFTGHYAESDGVEYPMILPK